MREELDSIIAEMRAEAEIRTAIQGHESRHEKKMLVWADRLAALAPSTGQGEWADVALCLSNELLPKDQCPDTPDRWLAAMRKHTATSAPGVDSVADAVRDSIKHIREQYPTDLWPIGGNSPTCKAARMARLTCDNIEHEFKQRMEALTQPTEGSDHDL